MIGADWVAQILKSEGVDFMGVILSSDSKKQEQRLVSAP